MDILFDSCYCYNKLEVLEYWYNYLLALLEKLGYGTRETEG